MRRRERGFTLVELLVVVSIIALLIAILLPSLKKARDQAKLTVCMSSLKQIGMAFSFYGEDNGQRPPPNRLKVSATAPSGGTPPEYKDSDWWYYGHMVPKHIPGNKKSQTNSAAGGVFVCPAERTAIRSYAMNIFASNYKYTEPFASQYDYARGLPFNPYSVKSPHLYLLVGEAWAMFPDSLNPGKYGTRYMIGQSGRSVYEMFCKVTEDATSAGGRGPFTGFIDFTKHKQSADFLFCDVHVENMKKTQVVKPDETSAGKWISTLKVQWSTWDPKADVNRATPP